MYEVVQLKLINIVCQLFFKQKKILAFYLQCIPIKIHRSGEDLCLLRCVVFVCLELLFLMFRKKSKEYE